MKKKIINTLVYIFKTYLLIMISSGVFGALIAAILYDPSINTHYGKPDMAFVLAAILIPPSNIIVFLILLFHKFNRIEIIVESCLYLLGQTFLYYDSLLYEIIPTALIMLLYLYIKKKILMYSGKVLPDNIE